MNYDPWFFIPMSTVIYVLLTYQLHILLSYSSKRYKRRDSNRKRYILNNLMKSGMLIYLTCVSLHEIQKIFRISGWQEHKQILINFSGLYTITDIIGTIIVFQKMRTKTIIHHIGVYAAFISIVLEVFPTDTYDFVHSIVIYGIYSSFAFSVNMYLALFHILTDTRLICKVSLINYKVVCLLNWITQLYILSHLLYQYNIVSSLIVISLLFAWIPDDIALMKTMNERTTEVYNDATFISKKDKIRKEHTDALELFLKVFKQIRQLDTQDDLTDVSIRISNGYKNAKSNVTKSYFECLDAIKNMQCELVQLRTKMLSESMLFSEDLPPVYEIHSE